MSLKLLAALVISLVFTVCQASDQLEPVSKIKPTVSNEGSLANEKLIADTTDGLKKILGESEINSETKILKFVIQQPVGNPGSRSWREMWLIDNAQGSGAKFLITFKESNLGSAEFEIKKM